MPYDFSKAFESDFNKAIQSFTGRNKVDVRELDDVVKKTGPLINVLDKLEKVNPGNEAGKKKEALWSEYEKLKEPLYTEVKKYGSIVDNALSKTDKKKWPNAYRDLKVIRTSLDLIQSQYVMVKELQSKVVIKYQEKTREDVEKETAKLRKDGKTDDEIKDLTYLLKVKSALTIFASAMRKNIAQAAAVVQKVKSDPTPATYNKCMSDGGRDLSQSLYNMLKVVKQPGAKDWELTKKAQALKPFEADLKAFGDGDKRTIDADATSDQVLARLKEFSALVKGVYPLTLGLEVEAKELAASAKK